MSSNVPDKPAKDLVERFQALETVQTSADLWSLYLKEANERAKAKVDLWNGSLGAFLLFAGLFAGVVSSFVIDSRARLQPTSSANLPAARVPISTLAINFLWFTSLTFTLISALAAVLAQTWIVKFSLVPTQGFKGAKERWIRDDKAEHWHLHTAITWITVLIQLSLFLFLAGFAVQAVADHKSLGWTILSFVGATLVLYIGITVLPWVYPTTPFGTPFSELNGRARNMYIFEAPSVNAATKSRRDVRKFIQSLWENFGKTPDDDEARLGICWSILKNSSNNASIHAAVSELIKNGSQSKQSQRLIDLGLPQELSNRLAHLPAGPENVERMKDYLHVIMWMVDDCTSDVAQGFSHLLESDGALLLALDTLPSACRALAFAIRVNLLLNVSEHGKIHGTDWAAMIEGLEPDLALDVFRTANSGLRVTRDRVKADSSHIRQDCARFLAAYIGSARFPNENLAKSRITGDHSRIPRTQQEFIGHIKTFFSQLEEAWKRSMCARAIRLMGDVRIDRQIMGFKVLSSVAENETFQDAVTNVLPELASTLKTVDWKTSVDCLGRLSEIAKHDSRGTFRGAIKTILPQIIELLSDSGEEVRNAVIDLGYQMGMKDWVVGEIKRISGDLLRDLSSSSSLIRFEGLHSLSELIKIDEIRTAIIGQERNITDCISFDDEDVKLAAIGTLQELAKDERFRDAINNNMPNILGLVSDEDSAVRAAAIDFESELSRKDSFQPAINRNIYDFMTDNSESKRWFARRDRLQALREIIVSEHSYAGGIQKVLADMHSWLSDSEEEVRQAALEVVSTVAAKATSVAAANTSSDADNASQVSLKKTISRAIPVVSAALDSSSHSSPRTQITALSTLSALAHTGDLTLAIPKIVALFTADEEDVKVSALTTCAQIAKIQPVALYTAGNSITAEILPTLNSSAAWETQVAALKTLSTLAETDGLCETLNDNALDKIFAGLSDDDSDVRAQVLKTLAVLATKERFHNKIKTAIQNTLPLLEDWEWTLEGGGFTVRRQALDTFTVFANYGIFVASDHEIISHLISMLSEGDTDMTTRVLVILSIAAEQDAGSFVRPSQVQRSVSAATHREISVVTNSLGHLNWRVRVAGLQVLESLATDAKYNKVSFPAQNTIVQCLADPVEEVRVAGLRTLFKFIDKDIFWERPNIPDTVPELISSLLRSESEDVRISGIGIISTYATKEVFYPLFNGVIPAIVELLDRPDEDSHVAMLTTICTLASTGKFTTDVAFVKGIGRIFPSLLSNGSVAVRMAALRILPVISGHDVFGEIVAEALEPLLKAVTRKEDVAGNVEEADDTFRIDVLNTLSDIAENETLSNKIQTRLSKSYALAAKGSWPARVAFLKLMSVLGTSAKDPLKRMVKQMIPDISDALHDKENDEVRMAGVQLLSISVVEDISSKDFNSLLTTLMTLLFDREEDVRITALQTLSDLAKQDAFREAIDGALPVILEALDRIETDTRVAALETCAALAQDVAFRGIINRAAPQIIACLTEADDDVRIAAMKSLSQLSREEAFWLIVSEAAPHIMSQLESGHWSIRLQALQTLSIFAENDAFGDVMNSFLPRILECMKDKDDDVRVEALEMLLNLVQQNLYRPSILGALQASGLTPLVDLTSDDFRRVRMAAIPLIPKVIELGGDVFHSTAGMVIAAVVQLLSHDDDECVAALEALRTLVEEDVAYAEELSPEISKLLEVLQPDDLKSRIPTTVLLTLAALVTQYKESVDQVVDAVITLFSIIKDTEEPQFWDATAKVFVALASLGSDPNDNVHKFVSSCVASALDDSNRHARMLGLLVMESITQGVTGFEVNDCRQSALEWVDLPDLDVRLSAIRVAASLNALDARNRDKLHAATQKTWRELTDITNSSVVGLEKLNKMADYVDVFINGQSTDVIPPITAALKDQSEEIALSCLRAIFKLASEYKFRATLVQVVPRITALLSNRKSDSPFRIGVLEYLLRLANYPQFRVKIQEQVSAIIPVLKDRDSKVRTAGLQILSKLVQEVSPESLSDRIKSTIPTLWTLIQNSTTREDSIALLTCLAADKTVRSELLAKLLPITLTSGSSKNAISWGQLLLIARLLEQERLKHEEWDLRFILCLITSKNAEVQDFVLKFMTTTLQQYLETWRKAEKFPPSLVSAFSSVALSKR